MYLDLAVLYSNIANVIDSVTICEPTMDLEFLVAVSDSIGSELVVKQLKYFGREIDSLLLYLKELKNFQLPHYMYFVVLTFIESQFN